MALAEVCGINSVVDFSYSRENKIDDEIEGYTKNFTNNLQLAVPPFVNVSVRENMQCHALLYAYPVRDDTIIK